MRKLISLLLLLATPLYAAPKHPLGWISKPNHSAGLRQIATHPAYRAAPLPASASVEALLPPVYDQLNLGSCVANAGAAAFDTNWKARTGKLAAPSRLDLYQNCLRHDGNAGKDVGTYTATALWVLLHNGTLLESFWSYVPANLAKRAPADTKLQRATYAAIKAYDVPSNDNGYAVRQAIANAHLPVMAGGYVFNQIFDVTAASPFIAMPRGRPAGGHEILFVAYDDNMTHDGLKGFVKIRNSWGAWGDKGCAWMPYAYAFNPKWFEDFGCIEITGKRK